MIIIICKVVNLARTDGHKHVYNVRLAQSSPRPAVATSSKYRTGLLVLCQFDAEDQSISILRQATAEDVWEQLDSTKPVNVSLKQANTEDSRQVIASSAASKGVLDDAKLSQLQNPIEDMSNALKTEMAKNADNRYIVSAFCDWNNSFKECDSAERGHLTLIIRSLSQLFLQAVEQNRSLCDSKRDQMLLTSLHKGDWLQAVTLILSGADIRQANERGDTLLMNSTAKRDYHLTKFLLAAGACPFEENGKGLSAFAISKRIKYEKFLTLFETFPRHTKKSGHLSTSSGPSSSFKEQMTLLQTQNQDEGNRPSGPTASESTTLADAQYLQDTSSDKHDATRYWGHSFRDGGQFGSHPGMDDFGDESSP